MNPARKKPRSLYQKLLNWTVILVSIMTIISLISSWISPVKFWLAALIGLAFPYLYFANLLFLTILLLKRRIMFVIPLIAFIIGVNMIPALFQVRLQDDTPDYVNEDDPGFRLISYNVRVFDLYNWTRNLDTREKIFRFFEEENADVVCIQEFYSSKKEGFNNLDLLKERLGMTHHHVEYPVIMKNTQYWGIATLSKLPIVDTGVLYFDEKKANVCIYSDILYKNDTLRIYNTHLQSVHFKSEDYKFIESLGADEHEKEKVSRTKEIVKRLKLAFIKRSEQADRISGHIETSPHPVIVCGDFNDTPVSYCYRKMKSGLVDAFRISGSGMGSTYLGPIPGLRIDYILHSPSLDSYDFRVRKVRLSDHYPLVSRFNLMNRQ